MTRRPAWAHRDPERDQGGFGGDGPGDRPDPVPDRLQVDRQPAETPATSSTRSSAVTLSSSEARFDADREASAQQK